MESARLIFTALETNNNKFWHGHVEGTTVKTNWGRVGDVGQFKDYPCGSVASAEALKRDCRHVRVDPQVRRKFCTGSH